LLAALAGRELGRDAVVKLEQVAWILPGVGGSILFALSDFVGCPA
jgi:hypothetical protein